MMSFSLDLDAGSRVEDEVMTITAAIEIIGLTKSYGDQAVLRGVDLRVPSGTIFALLGSNGAGKTTVVRILSTLLKSDGGTATVNGYDVATQPAKVPPRQVRSLYASRSVTGRLGAESESGR
jgi:ABC-type multidrug transport system ATPase subunit